VVLPPPLKGFQTTLEDRNGPSTNRATSRTATAADWNATSRTATATDRNGPSSNCATSRTATATFSEWAIEQLRYSPNRDGVLRMGHRATALLTEPRRCSQNGPSSNCATSRAATAFSEWAIARLRYSPNRDGNVLGMGHRATALL